MCVFVCVFERERVCERGLFIKSQCGTTSVSLEAFTTKELSTEVQQLNSTQDLDTHTRAHTHTNTHTHTH